MQEHEAHLFRGAIDAGKPFSQPEADLSELDDAGRVAFDALVSLIAQNAGEATHILGEDENKDANLVQTAAQALEAKDESYRAQLLRQTSAVLAAEYDFDVAYDSGSESVMSRNRDRLTPAATRIHRLRIFAARTAIFQLRNRSALVEEAGDNVA